MNFLALATSASESFGPFILIIVVAIGIALGLKRKKIKEAREQIICPNPRCGYVGKPIKKARADMFVGLILCLFCLIPGILYFLFKNGYIYKCPKCGMQISSDA